MCFEFLILVPCLEKRVVLLDHIVPKKWKFLNEDKIWAFMPGPNVNGVPMSYSN